MTAPERWSRIESHPAYSISDAGRVRRDRGGMGSRVGRILRAEVSSTGYFTVLLSGVYPRRRVAVHRLVATAFLTADPERQFVNHKNADKLDNRVENLEWVTRRENEDHAHTAGLKPRGETNGNSKLSERNILEIRSSTESLSVIGTRLGVSRGAISKIRNNKRWRHVPAQGVSR